MEAVPRLPMLGFKLKQSAEPATSFNNLKLYIAELYQEDPDSYSKEVHDLETLRNIACRPSHDQDGCLKLKRYYCQLNSLLHRFPLLVERPLLTFAWRDTYSNNTVAVSDLRHEMAVILYNIAALHAQLGSEEARTTPESMKLACTHFQCAAGALEMFKERGAPPEMTDLCSDVIMFWNRICLAQAQECILEKSLSDNRKAGIVAKVTSQIVNYYNSALALVIASGDDGLLADVVGSKQLKEWKKYLSFKVSYLSAILYMYQGQSAEESKKFGERVTLTQLAWDKLEEAKKEAKGIMCSEEVQKTLTATAEIVEAKRKAAKNENEFIYHEEVPDISTISAVQGANLVNGLVFSVTDSELLGTDIFHRLIPMKAHEGSSLYSEEKAQLLRTIGTKIEDRDAELNGFMSSLNMEFLQFDQGAVTKLPQAIVDRCASLNARPNAIPDLVALMSQLADTCGDVEMLLREIKQIFAEEEVHEKAYQQAMGQRPTVHLSELNREYQKYQEAHNKAGESNETLRKAMGLHVANLRTLSKPMAEIQAMVPVAGKNGESTTENPHFAELRKLLNKVTEMRGQRTQLVNGLREAINKDDITSKIVAWGEGDMKELFRQEMAKHEKTAALIDMNLVAQGNILKALTDCYAKCAGAIKQMSDTKHKRDQFFSALVASYDVYEDLLGKSAKGLEFYKKLHSNVAKLLTRVKAARDVQSEERQQRLNSTAKVAPVNMQSAGGGGSQEKVNTGPKLRDYMKAAGPGGFVPAVRPSPLGSENTSTSTCGTATSTDKFNSHTMTVATAGTMQYGVDNTVGHANQQSQQPQASQIQNYSATGITGDHGSYYNATSQPQSAYGQPAAPINTGYVNPIYQTGGYGHGSYNYPTSNAITSTTGHVVPSTTNYTVTSTVAPPVSAISSYSATAATLGSYQPQNTQSYYSAAGGHYGGSAYQAASGQTGYQTQQSYPGMSNTSQSTATGTSYTSVPTTYTAAVPTSSVAGTTTSYSQYSGHPQQDQQQQQPGYANQYAYLMGSSTVTPTTMTTATTANIPQVVSQQMSQMTISSTPTVSGNETSSSGYGNYYANQSQYPVQGYNTNNNNNNNSNSNVNQSYYGGEGSVQYSGQSQQPQQLYQYGTSQGGQNSTTGYTGGPQSQNVGQTNQGDQYNQYTSSSQGQQYGQYPTTSGGVYGGNSGWSSGGSTVGSGVAQQGYSVNQTGQYVNNPTQGYNNNQYATPTVTSQPAPTVVQPVTVEQQTTTATNTSPQPPTTSVPVEKPQVTSTPPVINPRNLDLLSGIDFAAPSASLPEPVLQPKPAGSTVSGGASTVGGDKNKAEEVNAKKSTVDEDVVSVLLETPQVPPNGAKMDHIKSFLMSAQQQTQSQCPSPSLSAVPMDRKMSMDNISVCSEISSIDQNFDWESVSVRNEVVGGEHEAILSKFGSAGGTGEDPKAIKYFHNEVERLEKFLEGVNIKTLNGSTPLDKKWQELQNLLAKEAGKRTTNVAKLFPEKNRSADCIPYDHARVQLPTATDDYVNACFVRELGSNCPTLILAQTPMQNTNKDFWHLVWSQKSKVIMCLHTPAEMMHPFWPTKVKEELHFDDFSVTLLKQFDLTNCVEYNLKLTMLGSDAVLELSALQLKAWSQNAPQQVVGVANDVITSYRQRVMTESGSGVAAAGPIVINCLTGSKRSPLVAVTVAAVLATKAKRPLLINVVDAWFRIAAQRRGVLENEKELEYSFQVVLNNGHDLLNKHGIMTTYQVKNAAKAAVIEKEQLKDPLSELDALWKMKK